MDLPTAQAWLKEHASRAGHARAIRQAYARATEDVWPSPAAEGGRMTSKPARRMIFKEAA